MIYTESGQFCLPIANYITHKSYVVVVAHPDDEILWFGSVLEGAQKIIFCYCDVATEKSLGSARRAVLSQYPYLNVISLDLPEGDFFNTANWEKPEEIFAGIAPLDSEVLLRYKNNFNVLVEKLSPHLENIDLVFSHNPWGEYGHEDHVQVNHAVRTIVAGYGAKMLVPEIYSEKTLVLRSKNCNVTNLQIFTKCIDRENILELKKLYQENNCWTWADDWEPVDEDYFLLLNEDEYQMESEDIENVEEIFQILIVDDGKIPNEIPPQIQSNIASIKALYPKSRHRLFSGNEIRGFIRENFSPDVLDTYDALTPYAYKADLARYCLLYFYGGLYVDIGIYLLQKLQIPVNRKIIYFRDLVTSSNVSWAVSNGILYAQPNCEEFKLAIDLVVSNFKNRHYGINSLCPTGPVLLGRVFAMLYRAESYYCGEVRYLVSDFPEKYPSFIDPDGNMVAWVKKPKVGYYLGFAGTNDYTDLWRRKQIYGDFEMIWSYTDVAIRCIEKNRMPAGIQIIKEYTGYQLYGPYIFLKAGKYKAVMHFLTGSINGVPFLDVCSNGGKTVYSDSCVVSNDEVFIEFRLNSSCSDLEIRLDSKKKFSGIYLGMKVMAMKD
ncbi:glycosyltransferase [Candidatus Nitrotoga fabula]|uniref:LmbE family protein n=1 Tax=Candidatus Nitrotoga fabula TaxID=2182327 RepID=A0A916F7X2_9PROT|nr:glycosyltransferase [Candidatus Nitrotoga fabula]CAE6687154.1 hypothetical protein NTGZN8_100004 [Candidatus Nitrotoga fabula]